MPHLLQVDFPMDGPFGAAMAEAFAELAHSINDEPGLIWKIWTENRDAGEAGGVYLFESEDDAERYLAMHSERLQSMGVEGIRGKIFEVNEALTTINHGPTEAR
ncbi:monooxygenase [Saccharopolyspora karakumensis]|uniref:Monooxygenase n=1 Tax=Saccharopolyspora karakumensis TaxID=2530386 RepID=A0A4R5BUT2_9PSEU|nr:monooxygenase [Saccharopolyspora karakumensis]TDD89446.1 monooxygenase [Saccharopolyspora karakumensis]